MVKMKYLLIFLFPALAFGQFATTYDSRWPETATPFQSKYPAYDIGETNLARNPDFNIRFREIPVPALWNIRIMLGVTITSTVNDAKARIDVSDLNYRPAHYALKDWFGTNDAQTLRASIRATKANFRTNATFSASLRRDFSRPLETEAEWAELREAKADEKQRLGIKEASP